MTFSSPRLRLSLKLRALLALGIVFSADVGRAQAPAAPPPANAPAPQPAAPPPPAPAPIAPPPALAPVPVGKGARLPGLRAIPPAQLKPAVPGATPAAPGAPGGVTTPGAQPGAAPGAAGTPAGAAGANPPNTVSLTDVTQHPENTKPAPYLVDFTIEDGDLTELITTISTITGKRFIYGGKVRNIKVNIYAPKHQKVSVAEAYQTFLSVLDANGLTVIPHGKFLKIVETPGIATQPTPIYGAGQPVPPDDRYVTRLYRLSHISADEVAALLGKFKSKDGDISVYSPGNLLIVTDTASNIRRLLDLVEEVDVGGAGDQVWVEPIHYGTAAEMAQRLNDIFDVKAGAAKPAAPAPGAVSGGGAATNETHITKILPDDRTNSLVIVATERAYLRVLELIRRLDVPQSGEGEVHVLPLQHAMAEELATTLNAILGGAGAAAPRAPAAAPGTPGAAASGIFEGTVRVTADKATNALVITSSLRDYAELRNVIDKLDMPRRQVFIDAVVMDLSIVHTTKLGVNFHGGDLADTGIGSGQSLIYGGLNPLSTILLPDPTQLQGLALGVRGPNIPGSENLLGTGISIPAFGVALQALATSGDANVLATPHVIATDNVPAEINIGENIPLQTNVGGGLGGLGGLPGAAGAAAGALGGLGGLGFGGFAAPRQDVGTKIKVVPHINDSDEVRLELTEEISNQGATSGTLGAVSIVKRNAQTTVVVQDQQTVIIGGLMRDAVTTKDTKIPILGDIPVLGFLFRNTERGTTKTNLLLILTPYVIRSQTDLRTIFQRKMQERQEFLDRYFVFSDQKDYEPPHDYSRANGLVEDIRQSYLTQAERLRLEEETKPRELKTHEPGQPIEMPLVPRRGGAAPPPGAPGAPGAPAPAPGVVPQGPIPGAPAPIPPNFPMPGQLPGAPAPAPAPAPPPGGGPQPPAPGPTGALDGTQSPPLVIAPSVRSVNVERVE